MTGLLSELPGPAARALAAFQSLVCARLGAAGGYLLEGGDGLALVAFGNAGCAVGWALDCVEALKAMVGRSGGRGGGRGDWGGEGGLEGRSLKSAGLHGGRGGAGRAVAARWGAGWGASKPSRLWCSPASPAVTDRGFVILGVSAM